jgi:hypothetical protein
MVHAMGLGTIATTTDLTGWIPTRVERDGDDLSISWCLAEGARFEEPFWTETVNRLMADPFRLLLQHSGDLADLQRHAEQHPAIKPSGFIYHLSRCGSTLAGRALGSLPGVCVLSEPAPLDHMLRAMADRPLDEQVLAARWILQALSPVETADDCQLVVKLDGWHIHLFPVLRLAFPDVPWIFLSREPVEVMVSHERQHGAQMIPGALPQPLLGVPHGDHSLVDYGAHVLAAMLRSAVHYHGDGGLLIDYSELPGAISTLIAPHFGISVDVPLHAVLSVNAKNPVLEFSPDGASKRASVSPKTQEAVDRIIGDAHQWFEQARRTQRAALQGPSPSAARLPLTFDLARLSAEIASLPDDEWVPHFNTGYFTGDWSGVALRSVEGRERWLYPDPTAQAAYADTPLLARCPALTEAIAAFACPILAARLLRLGPDSRIREHTDLDLGVDDGEARVHIVLESNDDVTFWLDGKPVPMRHGDAWYLNLNLPHRVENAGPTDRIHLVIDCVANDWLRNLIGHAGA